MKRKEIIKIATRQIKYPPICPVCADDAEYHSYITLNPSSSGFERPRDVRYYPAERYTEQRTVTGIQKAAFIRPTSTLPKTYLDIPTCENHEYSALQDNRKIISLFMLLTLMFASVFLVYQITNSYFLGLNWIPSFTSLILVLLVIGTLSAFTYYPPPIQRAFKILDMSRGGSFIYVQLSNPEYVARFIDLNAMSIEYIDSSQFQEETQR